MRLPVGERVNVNRGEARFVELRVREPLRVRRPAVVIDVAVLVLVDVGDPAAGHVEHAQGHVLVGEGQHLRVGRPERRELPGLPVARDLPLLARAVRIADVDLVLAIAIAEIRDRPAVRRPDRVALADSGRLGEIADLPFLRRRAEDVAARDEERTRAGWRRRVPLDVLFHAAEVREGVAEVAVDADGDALAAIGRGVEAVDVPAVLVHDLGFVGARPQHVVIVVSGDFFLLLGGEVVRPEIETTVFTIRGEVDRVADPHRLVIGVLVVRELLGLVGREVVDPDVLRASAAIALPGAELALDGRVNELRPVTRIRPRTPLGNGQRLLHSPFDVDHVMRGHAVGPGKAMRVEKDLLSIRRPVEHAVVDAAARRKRADVVVERQLPRRAAFRADHEDLPAAGVVAGESDPATVGRELREVLHPFAGGEPSRVTAAARREPDVARVNEGHRVAVNVGLAQEPGEPFLRECGRAHAEDNGEREGDRDQLFHGATV